MKKATSAGKYAAPSKSAPKSAAKTLAKIPANKMSAAKSSSGKPPAGKPSAGKLPAAKIAIGKAPAAKSPTKPGTIVAPVSRVPARTPERAEELKAKIGALASSTNQIRALKRSLNKSFYEIGTILGDVQTRRLYEAKGYGSFEAFVEREIDLGKQMSLRLVKVAQTFLKEAALAAGLDRVSAALSAFEGESETQNKSPSTPPPAMPIGRSALPPHKQ
ncbi:MAG: hypothetical protein IPK60_01990 [Sandaracinaceae bacterium]|nr:hypothetical protein [Sandaracinaceae bacterium]